MSFLLSCTSSITIILIVALCSLRLLRRKSATFRHWVLSVAVFAAAITPALIQAIPAWSPPILVASRQSAVSTPPVIQVEAARPSIQSERIVPAAWVVWLTGMSLGILAMITGLVRLARIGATSQRMTEERWTRLARLISAEYGLPRPVEVQQSRNTSILVTWGMLRPAIILPAGAEAWPEERVNVVLRHELAHVRRQDWLVQMAAQFLRVIFWFNPIVWLFCNRLHLESECACDDAVLSEVQAPEYAEHLLELARVLNKSNRAWSAAVAMARPSTVERRFAAMLSPTVNRRPITRIAMLATVVVGIGIAIPLAALRMPAAGQAPGATAEAKKTAGGWLAEIESEGYRDLDVDSLIELKGREIDGKFIHQFRDSGYQLTVDELVRFRNCDMTAEFIRMAKSRFKDITVDQLVQLKEFGVLD